MTQERLAYATGLSLSTVRKIETGEVVEPGFFPIMTILAVLGVEPSQLELSFMRQVKSVQHAGAGAVNVRGREKRR
jgi:transcriptional regulator with XRE-family HTH domain